MFHRQMVDISDQGNMAKSARVLLLAEGKRRSKRTFKEQSMKTFKSGDRVRVTGHSHPDVTPGSRGEVVCHLKGGYAVEIKNNPWAVAGSDNGTKVVETKTVWFDKKNLRKSVL